MALTAGTVQIPFYATGFRGDDLEAALAEIAPLSLRYGASDYAVYRQRDDRYRFLVLATFADKSDFERWWYGPEFIRMRTLCSSWYQVPVVYAWADKVTEGFMPTEQPLEREARGVGTGDIG